MKRSLQLLCLLLCLLFLPLSPACAAAPSGDAAPAIRVLLRRLAITDRVDLTLDGLYAATTASGTSLAFPRGAQVVVQIRSGQLVLFYQGMSLSAGDRLTLTRQASGAPSLQGLRFFAGNNQYPGDLTLTVTGGVIQPVLTISLEDYLLGVVPYEMSDSFPLEALKAQAVCARTYALAHVDASRAWDVVDTTNDQVFKGVDASNVNAARAVRETAGFVAMYGKYLATCYYSASNGGQTELPQNHWGGAAVRYYRIADDPYDLENPESLVLRARLSRKDPVLPEALSAAIFEQIAPTLAAQGFVPDERMFRIDRIEALSLGNPRHPAPSRLYTTLTLTISWSGRKLIPYTEPEEDISLFGTPAPTATPAVTATPAPAYTDFLPAEGPTDVTVDLFPTLIRVLKLSISGADNEMLSVSEQADHFTLEARRFGHGVGMSQRGAQQMASKYGKSWEEILFFYYPGVTLEKNPSGAIPLPTPAPDLFSTPGPSASPTPRPTLMPVTGEVPKGAWLAVVEGIADDSSLNLRSEPNQASSILMRLYKHQPLIVLETCEDPAWVHVRTDVAEGYVMASFLSPADN